MSQEVPAIIDMHHHAIPPLLRQKYRSNVQGSDWTLQQDRQAMTHLGITGALLSQPNSGNPDQVRQLNMFLAEASSEDPQQYGFLANLPYGDAEAACQEIAYVLDTLHGDGFALLSNYQGIYISDERLDAALAELDRRNAVVFVHPTNAANNNPLLFGRAAWIYEFPFDTTRAVMELVYTGKIARYPHIRWIIAHAGGTIPYLAYRLSLVQELQEDALAAEDVQAALNTLYYDLALSTSPAVFKALRELVDPTHILFGTDFPIRPEKSVAHSLLEFAKYTGFQPDEQQQILSGTAQSLFPRFRW